MKYLSLFICLFYNLCFTQNSTSFSDDFGEQSVWPQFDDEEGSGTIANGKYILKSKTEDGFPESCTYPYIDWKKDFSIEMTFTQTTFHAHNICGLIWAREGDTFNGFFVRMNGFFQVVTIKNNDVQAKIKDWTKEEYVKTTNKPNKLKVVKESGTYTFFVNGYVVYKTSAEKFISHNNGIGFIVEGHNTIEVDNFRFDQDVKINVIDDALLEKKKINLGVNVNSKYSDLNPIISADGKNLYYAVDGHPSNVGGDYQDVWYSSKVNDSTWAKSKNLGVPLNNIENNGVVSVSPDNNTLYLSGKYKKNGKPGGVGFSYSNRTASGWSVPLPINIKNFYNESMYQEACIGPDKKTMIFSALRKDSYGGNDLYVTTMITKDQWSEPVNLGSIINTDFDEASPFLAADGKTMYFSTNGRPGYGDMDVFVTKRLDNSWTKWSEPQNMGPYINSIEFDAYFSVSAKGDYAYMVTTLNSLGQEDIIKIQLSESSRPEPVVVIFGRVLDAKTKRPLSADLTYEELPDGKDLGNAISNPSTGEYKIVLPYGKLYALFGNRVGYIPQNETIDLLNIHEYAEIEKDLYLTPIEIGEKFVMNSVFFAQSTANILENSYPELDRFVDMLKANNKMEIEIGGHTDNIGDPARNQILSEERVVAIRNYFISKGIPEKRMLGKGYGDSQPIASNTKEETRKLNRRVEIKILKK